MAASTAVPAAATVEDVMETYLGLMKQDQPGVVDDGIGWADDYETSEQYKTDLGLFGALGSVREGVVKAMLQMEFALDDICLYEEKAYQCVRKACSRHADAPEASSAIQKSDITSQRTMYKAAKAVQKAAYAAEFTIEAGTIRIGQMTQEAKAIVTAAEDQLGAQTLRMCTKYPASMQVLGIDKVHEVFEMEAMVEHADKAYQRMLMGQLAANFCAEVTAKDAAAKKANVRRLVRQIEIPPVGRFTDSLRWCFGIISETVATESMDQVYRNVDTRRRLIMHNRKMLLEIVHQGAGVIRTMRNVETCLQDIQRDNETNFQPQIEQLSRLMSAK